MKIKISLLTALLFAIQITFSQSIPFFKSYDWDKNPSYKVTEGTTEDMISLKEKSVSEFYFNGDDLIEYFLEHNIIWLNSDDAIEGYNKIYLPFSSKAELKVNKARVITPEGKIINLDESKILTAVDEETGRQYKYFALEGITKGSFIEYIYVVKRAPAYMGRKLYLQNDYTIENAEFDLYSPENLVFKFKSFNGLQDVKEDTLTPGKLHWKIHLNNVKKLENEYQAPYNASRKFIVYKVDRNRAGDIANIVSYSKVAHNLYNTYFTAYSKETTVLIKNFIKELALDKKADQESIIRKVDDYIKTNIYTQDVYSDELEDLNVILTNKVANENGVLKLYIAVLKTLNIQPEIVLTTDRNELKFDVDFEANNFLTDFLLYFPNTKKYLSPNATGTRYGFPMPYVMDNYGLFIKEVTVDNVTSAEGKIKYIEPVSVGKTVDVMDMTVDFDKDNLTENTIHLDRSFSGYYAMNIQPFMHLILDKDDLVNSFIESITSEYEVTKSKLINDDSDLFGVKPLEVIADFTTEAFVEKAGRKYLFKLGDLIGQQTELYQEKERVLPLEEQFHRSYVRTLTINIPKGYQVTNLSDINIDNSFSKDDKKLFSFKSSYKLEGNKLIVTANEYYKENKIDVSIYKEYRKVINSAADFNKIVLLLELK